VREHVDDCATRVFDEEAANAPWLVGERVDDSEPASDGLGVHGVDCGGFTDVDTEARVGYTNTITLQSRGSSARPSLCTPRGELVYRPHKPDRFTSPDRPIERWEVELSTGAPLPWTRERQGQSE
jgi:hypothetical protein